MNEETYSLPKQAQEPIGASPTPPKKRLREYGVAFAHQLALILLSGLVAATSLLPLFVKGMTSNLQSQLFYTSWAFGQGQLPYVDTFSRAGFLYHVLAGVTQLYGSLLWLLPVHLFCLYLASHYLYKLVFYWTDQRSYGFNMAKLFLFFNLAFGFGGYYPFQLASPFIMIGLWLLVTHMDGLRKDEVFIAYGLTAALALAIDPYTLVFWLLAFFVLNLVNLSQGRLARGFYQNLAILLGLILVAYPMGYFVLNLDLLKPYLLETVVSIWQVFPAVEQWHNLLELLLPLLVLLLSGLLTGVLLLPRGFKKIAEQRAGLILISLSSLAYLALAILEQNRSTHDLLPIVPFGLILTGLVLSPDKPQSVDSGFSRRRQPIGRQEGFAFLKSHLYLPVLVGLAAIAWSAAPLVTQATSQKERETIAQYLSDHSDTKDLIYVWEESAQIYLASKRLAASHYPVPLATNLTSSDRDLLIDELLQKKARYFVVNTDYDLPEAVQDTLSSSYQPIKLKDLSQFVIYQQY